MIPWKTEIKENDKIFHTKEEFDAYQTRRNWKKISRPFEGQEVELWLYDGYCAYSIAVYCDALKGFFESHLDNMPEAETLVGEWLKTTLLEEYKEIEDYECDMFESTPREEWHKSPDGGERFYLQADFYNSVYPDD